jgi:hypothetical protein
MVKEKIESFGYLNLNSPLLAGGMNIGFDLFPAIGVAQ